MRFSALVHKCVRAISLLSTHPFAHHKQTHMHAHVHAHSQARQLGCAISKSFQYKTRPYTEHTHTESHVTEISCCVGAMSTPLSSSNRCHKLTHRYTSFFTHIITQTVGTTVNITLLRRALVFHFFSVMPTKRVFYCVYGMCFIIVLVNVCVLDVYSCVCEYACFAFNRLVQIAQVNVSKC